MGKTITLTAADGHELEAYRADPEGTSRGGIVVIQEIFGVNGHIRDVCDGFAADGYAAIAPAVFDRVERGIELDYDDAGKVRGREVRAELGWEGPMADVDAAAGALEPSGKVGVVGYCWGGSLAWLAACRLDVACAVGYYGGQIIGFNDETPRCPVILHFGETDASIPMDDVDAIRAAHADVPVHVYGDAGHGFNCDRRAAYHAESAKTARARTLAFFAEHLVAFIS